MLQGHPEAISILITCCKTYGTTHTDINTINSTFRSCTYSSFLASAVNEEGVAVNQQQMIKAWQKVRRRDNMPASQSAGRNMSTLPRFQVIEMRSGGRVDGIMEWCCTTWSTFKIALKSRDKIYTPSEKNKHVFAGQQWLNGISWFSTSSTWIQTGQIKLLQWVNLPR